MAIMKSSGRSRKVLASDRLKSMPSRVMASGAVVFLRISAIAMLVAEFLE